MTSNTLNSHFQGLFFMHFNPPRSSTDTTTPLVAHFTHALTPRQFLGTPYLHSHHPTAPRPIACWASSWPRASTRRTPPRTPRHLTASSSSTAQTACSRRRRHRQLHTPRPPDRDRARRVPFATPTAVVGSGGKAALKAAEVTGSRTVSSSWAPMISARSPMRSKSC